MLASLLVGGIAFVVQRRRAHLPATASAPSGDHVSSAAWPPIASDDDPQVANGGGVAAQRTTDLRPFVEVTPADGGDPPQWVAPIDGACPDGYPIKANDNSRIYHVPGGRFYDRTVPERCYAEADAAAADGYRAAKA